MADTDAYELKARHVAVTTEVLAFLNSLALMHGYDKSVYPMFFSVYNLYDVDTREDKDKVYADNRYPATLMMSQVHDTRKDVPCEKHIRTLWRVVCRGQYETDTLQTIDVWIDLPIEAYESLPDVPESMVMYDTFTDMTELDIKLGKGDVPVLSLEELRQNEMLVSDIEQYLDNTQEEE
tara:strand:+ start:1146 stop:1682 length:537 start_codon:yes stop_codon:yes gene_type:complete